MNVKRREIAVCIILSIVTCGIYALYWMACVTDDVNFMLNERDTTGGMCVLLTIITCGIYGYYWAYKMGTKITRLKMNANQGYVDGNTSILYVILQIFGLSIVVSALIQSEINNLSTM